MSLDFSNLADFDFDFDFDSYPLLDDFQPFGCSQAESSMGKSGSVTSDFFKPFDTVTDALFKQPSNTPTYNSYSDPETVEHPRATPLSSSLQQPAAPTSKAPNPQIPQASGLRHEPPRWVPCAPPPGFPQHLPRQQREPSRWTPCGPPPGYPAHFPRQQREPSLWVPCAPPPGFPAHLPRPPLRQAPYSPPPSVPRRQAYPTPVARMPFHHPEISERLGLQKYCQNPVSYSPQSPRSIPALGRTLQADPAKLSFTTIDPNLLASVKPPPQLTLEPLPNLNKGISTADGLPISASGSPTNRVSSPTPLPVLSSRMRKGSIHLEDLYGSDEDSDEEDCKLSSVPVSPSPRMPVPRKRKCSAEVSDDISQLDRKKSKVLAEIENTEDFIQGQGQMSQGDDDDDEDEISTTKRYRDRKNQHNLSRRSTRQKKRVVSYTA